MRIIFIIFLVMYGSKVAFSYPYEKPLCFSVAVILLVVVVVVFLCVWFVFCLVGFFFFVVFPSMSLLRLPDSALD